MLVLNNEIMKKLHQSRRENRRSPSIQADSRDGEAPGVRAVPVPKVVEPQVGGVAQRESGRGSAGVLRTAWVGSSFVVLNIVCILRIPQL